MAVRASQKMQDFASAIFSRCRCWGSKDALLIAILCSGALMLLAGVCRPALHLWWVRVAGTNRRLPAKQTQSSGQHTKLCQTWPYRLRWER